MQSTVLELRGKCGCTDVTVLAYPARRTGNGDLELVNKVVFNFPQTLYSKEVLQNSPSISPNSGQRFSCSQGSFSASFIALTFRVS